jgi:hypothetical protein
VMETEPSQHSAARMGATNDDNGTRGMKFSSARKRIQAPTLPVHTSSRPCSALHG